MEEFSKEERARIASSFREDIKKYGVAQAVYAVLTSQSPKVPFRIVVLQQQCRKPSFKKAFEEACKSLHSSHPSLRPAIMTLQQKMEG